MTARINKTTAFAGCGVTLMDRIQGNGATNITQASITSIAYTVTSYGSETEAEEASNGTAVIASSPLTKTSVVFDTLQTAAPWDSTADSTGYNFRYDSPAADRPTGHKWHRFDIVFTPASGAKFAVVWIVETLPMQA
jgi:hypothetical protein